MNIQDAIAQGHVLAVEILGEGRTRDIRFVPAHLWRTKTGIVWCGMGWGASPGHEAHRVDGRVKGTGPWTIRGEVVTVRIDFTNSDERADLPWYREHSELGKTDTEKGALAYARDRCGDFDPVPGRLRP